MNRLLLIAILAAGAAMYFEDSFVGQPRESVTASEIWAVDGDTLGRGDDRYRLVGFDTPETYRAQCAEERALGLKAKDRLTELIESAGGLELDVQKHRDKYQRLLARAYADGQDVGDILISEGLARPYSGGKRQPWCT